MHGFWNAIVLVFVLAVYIYPISKILTRVGWNPWLSLLWLVPALNVAMLWVLAFARWPAKGEKHAP
ncbi:MAG: hypothetical protein ACREFW_04830 [Rhizomicrobium sp.]